MIEISLQNGVRFPDPEGRIREYCDIEIYTGYDDQHSINDKLSTNDIRAANKLYASIDRYDPLESRELLSSSEIPPLLHGIEDIELGNLEINEYETMKGLIRSIISEFLSIKGIGLAKTMKILHLKRPHLFPILDSFVVKFLADIEVSDIAKNRLLEVGLRTLDISHHDIVTNKGAFVELQRKLEDLPIPLTTVRLYDVLCWTTEKWVNRRDRKAPYGTAGKSIGQDTATEVFPSSGNMPDPNPSPIEICTKEEFRKVRQNDRGIIVITDNATPTRAHIPNCRWVTAENFNVKVIINKSRNGKYFWVNSLTTAVRSFSASRCNTCRPG